MHNHRSAWNQCLQIIQNQVDEKSFKTWFEPIVPLSLHGQQLTIEIPSQYFYEWLEEHFVKELQFALQTVIGPKARLEYSIVVDQGDRNNRPLHMTLPNQGNGTPAPVKQENGAFKEGYPNLKPVPQHIQQMNGNNADTGMKTGKSAFFHRLEKDRIFDESNLIPSYSFDNFVEGDCNRLARSAGLAVAFKPGITSFNPLMLYGGVGLGKTHLMHAIGNKIRELDNQRKVIYISSEKFTNQFIESLTKNAANDFTEHYMHMDVLIIDDVQFLAGKEKTQEIFFHIFNHLQQAGKQIILSSDCSPKDLKGMHERLISRFKWGLTADLQQPDFETRMAIIQKKMQNDGVHMPIEVVEYLAINIDTNIRELEGALISLIAQSSLNKQEFDLTLAKKILENIVHNIEKEVDIDKIQRSVSAYFSVSIHDLKDKTRKKEVATARQVAMYFAKEYTDYSLKQIGQYFGGRDHSTVIHAVQCVHNLIDTDNSFKRTVDDLKKQLQTN
jgi:chromosomal replication initiator protein